MFTAVTTFQYRLSNKGQPICDTYTQIHLDMDTKFRHSERLTITLVQME